MGEHDNRTEMKIAVQQEEGCLMSVFQLTCQLKGFTVCVLK